MRALVSCTHLIRDLDEFRQQFLAAGIEPVAADVPGQQLEGEELVRQLVGCDGVVAGDDAFSRDVIERSPQLRAIAKWGIGTDGIDFAAAADHDIRVSNTPGMFDDEVADVAIAYLITLARGLHLIDRGVRDGAWPKPPGRSLKGQTLAVVGFGGIGRATARRAVAMGMHVLAVDPGPAAQSAATEDGVQVLGLHEALRQADAVSLHCPLNQATHHLMDAAAFAVLRPGALLVNVARGPVVDEVALLAALADGTVETAALDVFEDEPLPTDDPLRSVDHLVFGSHNASNTTHAAARTHTASITNLIRDLGDST
jgi:D-3-phosphoglycerate dehydrogenase